MKGCRHVWALFCLGTHWIAENPYSAVDWRVDICIHCYAKREARR